MAIGYAARGGTDESDPTFGEGGVYSITDAHRFQEQLVEPVAAGHGRMEVTRLCAGGVPTEPSLFRIARIEQGMRSGRLGTSAIRRAWRKSFMKARPEVLLHLAAQPLVRESFRDPDRDLFGQCGWDGDGPRCRA